MAFAVSGRNVIFQNKTLVCLRPKKTEEDFTLIVFFPLAASEARLSTLLPNQDIPASLYSFMYIAY